MLNNLVIFNANLVLPERVLNNSAVVVKNGCIVDIIPYNTNLSGFSDNFELIDAGGKLVMPGLIDIHTDAMDFEICPRAMADFPIQVAFRELERKMAGCGITTVYHSLHLGYEVAEKQNRSKFSRKEVFEEVFNASRKNTVINNKIHLRFEVTGIGAFELSKEFVKKGYIDLHSIMDHTPGQGQLSNENFIKYARRNQLSEEQAREELKYRTSLPRVEGQQLKDLVYVLKEAKIPIASHDDDSVHKVQQMFELGVDICEFPINYETAERAKALGMHSVGGASNVLRGGSTGGNLNVQEAVSKGVIDTLCSDYYPSAILHSIFKMASNNIMSWPEAVRLATLNPAKAVKIDHTTGSIEKNKNADLIIVDSIDDLPLVTHTIVKGKVITQCQIFNKTQQYAYSD